MYVIYAGAFNEMFICFAKHVRQCVMQHEIDMDTICSVFGLFNIQLETLIKTQ